MHLSGCDCFCVGICILLRDEEKEITVGFVYVGDASTAYTSNFIDAQEAIQTKYRDQVKVIALNNVAEGTESEYLQQLVYAGCDLIFTTSYNYGTVTKEFAENIPGLSFVWQHVRMQMKNLF